MHPFVKEVFDPRAGRIDQTTGLPGEFLAGIDIFRLDNPQAVFAFCRNCPGTSPDLATFTYHHLRVSQYQTRIVYPAVGIFETAHDFRF